MDYKKEISLYFRRISRYWRLYNMSNAFGNNTYILKTIESELNELYDLLNEYHSNIESNKQFQK
ncbi:MAG: hypothetical protein ACLFMO_06080 [Eubacteriales bacterium]